MKILFIGGEPQTIDKVQLAMRLRWPDVEVVVGENSDSGLDLIERENPDMVFLESSGALSVPSTSATVKEVRRFSEVPLIVLERDGFGAEMDEVQALEAGSDDYIKANAGIIDLVARVAALMRRVWRLQPTPNDQVLSCGGLLLNPATYEVFLDSRRLTLTSTEFRLLHLLLKNRGTIVTHRVMELAVWGDQVDRSAVAKKYIQRLRQKLGGDPEGRPWIATVHGVGYRLIGNADANLPELGIQVATPVAS